MSSSATQQLADSLAAKIADHSAKVGIIGLGYVGLPLISAFVNSGFHCLGFDVDVGKVQMLQQGRSYIRHISSDTVAGWISRGQLDPTSDMQRLGEADALLIAVPTPLNESRPGPAVHRINGHFNCSGTAPRAVDRP